MPLLDLKEASGLSNKAWDKTIKSLTKIQMVVVAKEADALTCTLKDS